MTRLSGPRRLLAALAIAVVVVGVLIAVLGPSERPPTGRKLPGQPARELARGSVGGLSARGELAAAAAYLGVSQQQLRTSLRSGRSLAEVAAAGGRSVAGLEQRLIALRVSARAKQLGELPARQRKLVQAGIRQRVAASVVRHRFGGQPGAGINVRIASAYLGMAPAQLRAQLRRGRSLAQVAASTRGHSAAGLISALVAARRRLLDRARAAGGISAGVEQHALATLTARITATVNRPPGR
jgi:hypothetical protein